MNRAVSIALVLLGLIAGSPRVAWGVLAHSSPADAGVQVPGIAPAIPSPGERRAEHPQRINAQSATMQDAGLLAALLPAAGPSIIPPHTHRVDETQPEYLKIRLRGTPKNHRSPPA